jgi:putative spermidine/putrescine transport system permease protein
MTAPAILPARGLADRLTASLLAASAPAACPAPDPAASVAGRGLSRLARRAASAKSFYSIDEFSGVVKEEFTLKTYGELLRPSNFDILVRTVTMAAAVTLACAVLAFPIAYFAARYAKGHWKAAFYLGVMLPLWSSYLVKVYAWKLILAKEGIIGWAAEQTHTSLDHRRVPVDPGSWKARRSRPLRSGPSWSSSTSGCPT